MISSAKREIIQILSGKHENLNPPDYILLRVQIDSELRYGEDLTKYRTRHYVAQVIERLIFGNLLLEGKRKVEGEEQGIGAGSCASCR